jgi:hypothetical protein
LATSQKLTKQKKNEKEDSYGSYTGDFSPNFDLKSVILTYTNDF